MNFYVSKRPAKRRVNKFFIVVIASVILLCLAFFANKLRESFRKPANCYNIYDNLFGLMVYEDRTLAESFASDLVVVSDDVSVKRVNTKNADAACLFALNQKEVIYSKNAHKIVYPASITKVMTALLVLENSEMDDDVKITDVIKKLPGGSSSSNIKVGDVMTVEQLLYAMLLPSGGDASLALAEHISGDVDEFCRLMNERAHKLGATGTNFMNPHGFFEKKHYTTAYDIYLIFNEAIKHEEFLKIISTPKFICNYTSADNKAAQLTFTNTNRYINGEHKPKLDTLIIGGKTGYTSEAGRCLVLLSRDEDNNSYISIIMKAKDQTMLYSQMDNLLKEID